MLDQRLSGSCVFQTPDGTTHGVPLPQPGPLGEEHGLVEI